jgi:hypothetical protein
MYSTFDAIRNFIVGDVTALIEKNRIEVADDSGGVRTNGAALSGLTLGLSYQINIVLPETENVAVFNAIFRSLRDNLLR